MRTFVLFLLSTFTYFYSFAQNSSPYQKGESYIFVVLTKQPQEFEFKIIDTISFEIKGKRFVDLVSSKFQVEWNSKKNSDYQEIRSINLSKNNIDLQMPILLDYFQKEAIAIAPYPYFAEDMKMGFRLESNQAFSKEYNKLNGRNIKQLKSVVEDFFQLEFNGELINCKVAEGYNMSDIDELGRFQVVTYFNKKYGFIMISYIYPSGKIIELRKV